jgi:alpha/beta superfamily hydrolase
MQELNINFHSDSLTLEGCLALPDTAAFCPGVLLCHPHPLYGGNMDNNIIKAVSLALTARGMATLRFNFRGVGHSQGSFADGIGELDDARAALLFFSGREEIDPERTGIMGYSFGGMIAFSVGVQSTLVKAMAGISPVVPPGLLRECSKPTLLIYGTEDDVVPPATIMQEVKNMTVSGNVEAITGADHFWWGYEKKVAERVADFFAGNLGL